MDANPRWVHFRIRDVYHPDPVRLLAHLHGDDLLQGRIVEFTDSGSRAAAYAVIRVEGLERPVIVPVDRILGSLE